VQTPLRPLPAAVARWTAVARVVRWLDALVAWAVLWAATGLLGTPRALAAVVALVVVAFGSLARPLRVRWRPITGTVGLFLTSRLTPGDHVWYVRPGRAQRVLVTGRRGVHVAITPLSDEGAEGLSVRRTRVLLVPAAPSS
jgi:hypothetical protein